LSLPKPAQVLAPHSFKEDTNQSYLLLVRMAISAQIFGPAG
jgi:hypothetical protein